MTSESQITGEATLRKPELANSMIYMGGMLHSYLVSSSETEGGLMMIRFLARPGCEPPVHVHHYEHEIFYIFEGKVEFFVEGEPKGLLAGPGHTVHLPRERAHGFVFRSPQVAPWHLPMQ